jgi:hypothetical protein
VPLTNSAFPNNKRIHHINWFAFISRLAGTLASPTLDSLWNPVWAFPSIGSTFAVTNSKFLPYPILIPSHIPPSRTVTRTCFGKTVITFAYELRLRYFFKKNWVESNFASNRTHPSWVCPWEEAQIRLLRHLTQSQDGALNFVLKIVEFLYATSFVQLS